MHTSNRIRKWIVSIDRTSYCFRRIFKDLWRFSDVFKKTSGDQVGRQEVGNVKAVVGVGMTGRCYAIPTMDGSIDLIRLHFDDFTAYAKAHPELTFLVTHIGCGIAGWRDSEIASLFREASEFDNVALPEEFWAILNKR